MYTNTINILRNLKGSKNGARTTRLRHGILVPSALLFLARTTRGHPGLDAPALA